MNNVVSTKLRNRIESAIDARFIHLHHETPRKSIVYSEMRDEVLDLARALASVTNRDAQTNVTNALMLLSLLGMKQGVLEVQDAADLTRDMTRERHAELDTELRVESFTNFHVSFYEFIAALERIYAIRLRYSIYVEGGPRDLTREYAFSVRAESLEEAKKIAKRRIKNRDNSTEGWFNCKVSAIHKFEGRY